MSVEIEEIEESRDKARGERSQKKVSTLTGRKYQCCNSYCMGKCIQHTSLSVGEGGGLLLSVFLSVGREGEAEIRRV
jgi:hypothetical protein